MITLMAMLAKEAVESIRDKEKKHLENIFQEIEKEIQEDDTLKSILSLNKINNLNELFLFIQNQNLKHDIVKELEKLNLTLADVKISILSSAKEFNKKMEEIGIDESVIYYSMAAFKNGEKISGRIIAMLMDKTQSELENKVYEFNEKNKKVIKKTSFGEILKKDSERTKEEIRKKKIMSEEIKNEDKKPEMGMPKRGNPGVNGPGL